MKKTPKMALGIMGLLAVASMTVFAATLPVPGASATKTTTDHLSVRVASNTSYVEVDSPKSDSTLAHAEQAIQFSYERLNRIVTKLEYYDDDGNLQSVTIDDSSVPTDMQEYGEGTVGFNFSDLNLGYGEYTVKMIGYGLDGVEYEDAISIEYVPVITTIEQDSETEDVYANLDYDVDNPDIDSIQIDIYDENGKLVESISPIIVPRGTTKVELPLYEKNVAEGKYTVVTTALNSAGGELYEPYTVGLNYTTKAEPSKVPNTGGSTAGALNISQTDYLITGLIILSITGFAGIYFIARGKNTKKRSRK